MSEEKKNKNGASGKKPEALVDLVSEPEVSPDTDDFERQLQKTLKETEEAVLQNTKVELTPDQAKSWQSARTIINDFRPVPWFIWRLSNFVFSKPGQEAEISEGLVFGLRRLMFAVASDQVLGAGTKINNVRKALQVVPCDVVAAVSVIHAVCRRLSSKAHDRIWRPILDDALLRARIGLEVGAQDPSFGPGRGMLAGFAGRCGLVILISTGELEEARTALEMLATGSEIRDVGNLIYKCDPLQVSAMTLSAAGCGRDAAFGTVSYALRHSAELVASAEQLKWLSAFAITEGVRAGRASEVPQQFWEQLGFSEKDREEIAVSSKRLVRRGHGWNWII
ncbi:hypothetical protein OAO01_02375 [Oligoflexia bacterium]|nr:hypothetical protein [Oligoflexia bacterium]